MRLSLRYKAALLIALTELALLALLLVTNLYQSRRDFEQELRVHAQATAELLATSAREPLLAYDLSQLHNLLAGTIDKHRVRYAAITDHRGRVLAEAGIHLGPDQAVEARYPILVADSRFGEVTLAVSRSETEQALRQTTRSNLLIAAIEIVLVAAISLTLGWFLTRNLGTLARAAQALGRGDYAARVPLTGNDEVADLGKNFNGMAAELQRHTAALARSERRFRDLADNTSDWLWETDADGRYTYASNRVQALLGFTPDEIVGRGAFDLMQRDDAKRLEGMFRVAREQRRSFYGFEYRAQQRDGAIVTLEANGSPIVADDGTLLGYRGVTRDVSQRKDDEARLVYLAEHDTLTGLWTRHKFLDILEQEIRVAARMRQSLTVLFIDIDGFKLINDTHGHIAGDSLLYIVGDLLRKNVPDEHEVARLGGDEFGVLLRGGDASQGAEMAKRLLESLRGAELALAHGAITLSAGIGICVYPEGGDDSETLLANADVAMSHAKALGHNRHYLYQASDKDREHMQSKINWQGIIQESLQFDRLHLHLQPIVCVSDISARPHYEALVRVRDRQQSPVAASHFIGTAEHTGLVAEIDRWVLHNVLRLMRQASLADAVISLNLSGRSLNTPGFLEHVEAQALGSGIAPERLVFEVTESVAVAEMTKAENFIATMKRRGYRFALDDFGAGFSSLSYLKHLPVDQIKIDGSFIRYLESNRQDQILVRALIQVARELGLETVAEFVETKAVLDLLIEMGVDFVQGHYVGKPGALLLPHSMANNGE